MKLFLNDNIRSYSLQRGVTRCFWHISDGLIKHYGGAVTIFSPARRNFGAARHLRSLQLDFKGSYRFRLYQITDKLAEWASNRERATVFFSPYYGTSHPKAAEIFIVHDMIHALPEYRNDHPLAARFRRQVRNCLERASCLIAVSNNTARDIVKCYPHIAPEKIVTIHHGVDTSFFEAAKNSPASTGKPFFLFVGNRNGYKNFLRLLQAFGESGLAKQFDLRVISPVQKTFTPEESELIRKYSLAGSVYIAGSGEEDLRASYASTVAFVCPSEYEGFGMSVLEAMASGAVVAASNRSSIPEAGGEAAIYFDPLDVDSIIDCLRRVANLSSEGRDRLKHKGRAHAREFTWERAVQNTVQVINRFI
jgi:glycosyltransferase involved in cell wall biosynthesis